MGIQTKICGIRTPDALQAAVEGGARFVGFVFYSPSPRAISLDMAKELALTLPTGVRSVALFVDPSDEALEAVLGHVPIDMIQLHGDETPTRVAQIREKYTLPVIKAFPVRTEDDIEKVGDYAAADWFLFDAKSVDPNFHGGTGQSFDWNLLKGKIFSKPWMLSGGLTPENVRDALGVLSPDAVDVSSGVERARGVKDAGKIRAFLAAVNGV